MFKSPQVPGIRSLDGLIRAVILDGKSFITSENFLIDGSMVHFDGINHFFPPSSSSLHLFHLHWDRRLGWLGVSRSFELLFNVLFTDFGISNHIPLTTIILCSTCNPWIWAKDNTLWVSSFRWLSSMLFRVFGSTSFIKISVAPSLRRVDFF